jgi:hypothetical protein
MPEPESGHNWIEMNDLEPCSTAESSISGPSRDPHSAQTLPPCPIHSTGSTYSQATLYENDGRSSRQASTTTAVGADDDASIRGLPPTPADQRSGRSSPAPPEEVVSDDESGEFGGSGQNEVASMTGDDGSS